MSVAFYPSKKYEKNAKKLFLANECPEKFDGIFGPRRDSQPFRMAARMARFFSAQVDEFKKLLEIAMHDCGVKISANEVLAGKPLMVLIKGKPGMVRVFTNLIIDEPEHDIMKSVCWIVGLPVLDTFWKSYQEDIKDNVRSQAWTVTGRAWKRIRKSEEVPLARALTRFTKLPEHAKDDTIRNVAVAIEEQLKPMELVYVDKPSEYIDMYASGPHSCMSVSKARDGQWEWLMKEYKHHPCSFYAYHPYIRGVYVKYRGDVAARTLLYQQENGKWQYGRVYASNPKFQEKFERTLREAGYTWMGDHKTVKYARKAEFEIPAFEHGKDHYWLVSPYMDNVRDCVHAEFDAANKRFLITCEGKEPNVSVVNQAGIMAASTLTYAKCVHCKRKITTPRIDDTGRVFCSWECGQRCGCVLAYDNIGNYHLLQPANAYFDKYTSRYWTNKGACVARGGLPVMFHTGEIDEEENVTGAGIVVQHEGVYYRIPNNYEEIYRTGELRPTGKRNPAGFDTYELVKMDALKPKIEVKTQKTVIIDDEKDTLIAA